MSKWAKYGKKYNKDWERESVLKDWIQAHPVDDSKALCRYCKSEIRAHHADLVQHAATNKHQKNAKPLSSMRLTNFGVTVEKKNESQQIKEIKLASYIACHTAITSVDHLGELVQSTFDPSIKLHRTKCTAIINHVIAPCMFRDLLADIGETQYSLVIDESTNVRYFSR